MHSLLGKINFLRKFILDFVQFVKPLQNMIKKDLVFKWNKEENDSFYLIKIPIVEAPSLSSLNFMRDFILYTFASNLSLVIVFMQKDNNNEERPIYFLSIRQQGTKINFLDIDKKAYAVYKVV